MIKTVPLCFAFIMLLTHSLMAQDDKSPTVQFLNKRGYSFAPHEIDTVKGGSRKWPDSLYYYTPYKSKLLGSPTIPISFSKIVLVNGQYQVTPVISIGYGYAWFFGNFIFNEADNITVNPTFYFGPIADVGLQNNLSLNKLASFFTGAFVGFSSFSFFFGYDYISHSATLGVGGRIDLYTFHPTSLKPIGKVREVRKHKTSAPPILNE